MTKDDLKKYFRTYTEQVPLLIEAKAYWALLHYIIIFPDICGGLQSCDGKASKKRYKDWCRLYLADKFLSEDELYDIRCLLLHQGITLGRKRYSNYKFGQPDPNGNIVHKCILSGNVLVLDVSLFTKEIIGALDKWFNDISDNNFSEEVIKNIEKNIKHLVQTETSDKSFGKDISGLNMSISASTQNR